LEEAINERTRAIVSTHLFGYPLNVDRLNEIVRAAEARYGHKIWVIQDCAHSFGATWKGKLVCNEGDIALYGLNISKTINSIFGGMITTNDVSLYEALQQWRDAHFRQPSVQKSLARYLYLIAVYFAFKEPLYAFVVKLQEASRILDRYTKFYHLDDVIHFPPDYLDLMLPIEAAVGLVQLRKYERIINRRREIASFYDEKLQGISGIILPPIVEGATYSHYVVRVPDKNALIKAMRQKGVQLGEVIQYSIPHGEAYQKFVQDSSKFQNSYQSSRGVVNLPIFPTLSIKRQAAIVDHFVESQRITALST
jgi:dTDP-4-amino-4,6-dideoxygalactose transaminase